MNDLEMAAFIEKVAEQYGHVDTKSFSETTRFKELEGWSSLMALLIISMAYEDYNVTLSREDIRQTKTLFDLYERVKNKVSR